MNSSTPPQKIYLHTFFGEKQISKIRQSLFKFYQHSYANCTILDNSIQNDVSEQINAIIHSHQAVFCATDTNSHEIIAVLSYRTFNEYHIYKKNNETISMQHPSILLIKDDESRIQYHKLREMLNIMAIQYIDLNKISINSVARCGPLFVKKEYQ